MTVRPLSQTNDPIAQRLSAVLAQLDRIVVGKREPLKLAFACLLARGHLLIEDIPGVGKSTLAQALATTLGLKYARVQFTSDLLPADVLGVSIFDTETRCVPLSPRSDLPLGRARRRNQPRAAEDAKRADGSDGRAAGVAGRRDAQAARSVLRHRHAEPRRADRRLSAARIAARPLPDGDRNRLSRSRRRARAPDRAATAACKSRRCHRSRIRRRCSNGSAKPPQCTSRRRCSITCRRCSPRRAATSAPARTPARDAASRRAPACCCSRRRAHGRCCRGRPMALPEDVQAVFPSVAGHRLAGGARAGALQAQALLRTVALP